ncbi:PH domain-containing protein [Nocardioides sp.]|uniref:PH domain-containing protein n=1 Tax=Nocardioides sp. TaxID=35761 RepID=UPI0031FEA22C|nr:rane-flanked domain [Nocardioides sp.]
MTETVARQELARDHDWQRLDPRMLLVHPVKELLRFLPVLIGIFLAGAGSGGPRWELIGVAVPIGLGVLRYLTTSFRIADGRVELRRGLLNRHVLSTPLDRVRTIDLTASPIHRLLGLTTVRIGTGTASTSGDDRLDLDGLPVDRARTLREDLLQVAPEDAPAGAAPSGPRVVLGFDPAWIRFAPLTSSGLVIAAGVLGASSQLVNTLGGFDRFDPSGWGNSVTGLPVWAAVAGGLVTLLVLVSGLAIGGYVVANWGFTLTHAAGAWHLRRGLLTTRETSLDDDRVAGVSLCEPIGLRLAGGGQLRAIVTGLDKQQGSAVLVPPAPFRVGMAVARDVLGVAGPVDAPLVGHGPAARRRRYTRALLPAGVLLVADLFVVVREDLSAWLLAPALVVLASAGFVAADRAASLGHTLVDRYVVSRSGSLHRRRDALSVDHVIGWNLRSTWFQRRVGLTSLVATTAGGSQSVRILDVPENEAVALADDAVADLVGQFTA